MPESLTQFLCKFLTDERRQRFDEVLQYRTRHLTVVLENIFHAHNASACLRTCDCFGIQDVHIIETVNSFEPNPEISLGASQWLTIHRHTTAADNSGQELPDTSDATRTCIRGLKAKGYKVLATSPRQTSVAIDDIPIDDKTAMILGAEQMGVSETAIEEADQLVHVPMFGFTESFNISVTVAILLRHFTTQLHQSKTAWQLPESEKQALLLEWVSQSLGEKLEPLKRRYQSESL